MPYFMNLENLLPRLLDLGSKSAVIILAAILAELAWRRTSAANRHAIWMTLLAALLLLPLTAFSNPHWTFIWRRPAEPQTAPALPQIDSRLELPALPATAAIAENSAISHFSPPRWMALLARAWICGAALLLVHRAVVNWKMRRFVRNGLPMSDERLLALAREAARGTSAPWELRESPSCPAPLVHGVRKPVILLPPDARNWTDERLSAALLHEFGHVRRGDCLTRLLMDFVCAIYWFNPLAWIASRKMRIAQEQACDDIVLCAGVNATDYASQLVEIVRSFTPAARHAMAMAQPSTLETRVRAIVDLDCDRRPLGRAALAGGSLAVVAALAVCGVAQLRGANEKADVSPSPSKRLGNETEISSERLDYDSEKGTVTASGNTVVKMGNMILTGDKLVIKLIVATVNDEPITEAEVAEKIPAADRGSAEIRKATIEKLIDRALLLQAVKKAGYNPFPEILNERIQAIVNQNFGGDQAKFEATLAKQGYTMESFTKKQEEEVLISAMQTNIRKAANATTKEAYKQAVDTWLAEARAKARITYK